jgi:hypothetical protein
MDPEDRMGRGEAGIKGPPDFQSPAIRASTGDDATSA